MDTTGVPKPEKGVTVNIVVHNPEHMKYMSKVGIYLMYYCKDCPYNSQALLDVTKHVSDNHLVEQSEALPDSTGEVAEESCQPEHGQECLISAGDILGAEDSDETLSHKNESFAQPISTDVKYSQQVSAETTKRSKRGRKRKEMGDTQEKAAPEADEEEMMATRGDDDEDCDLIPRQYFCADCPYTFMYSAVELEQHALCHTDVTSSSTDKPELTCYICRPKRGRKLEGLERSQGQVWFHLKQHLHQRHGVDYQISCTKCDAVLKSHLEFKSHKESHSVSCDLCKFSSMTESDVTAHRKCHVTGDAREFKCHVCGYQSEREPGKWSLVHAHLVSRHPGEISALYQCKLCTKGFQSLRQHRVHVAVCKKASSSTCIKCGIKVHPKQYQAHMLTHDDIIEERVTEISQSTSSVGPVYVEISSGAATQIETTDPTNEQKPSISIISVNSEEPETSEEAGETPSSNADATIYICELHHTAYNSKEEFSQHLSEEHNQLEMPEDETLIPPETPDQTESKPQGEVVKCPTCYKKFQSEQRLNKHISRVHVNQDKLVSCDICGKDFKNKVRLRNHVREVHEGVKRTRVKHVLKSDKPVTYHICETCGYTTPSSLRLQNHQLSAHQGILRYQCDKCDYKTNEKSDIYRHKWRHSHVKKFNCEMCTYKTNTRWLMVNHAYKRHGIQLPKQSKDTMGCLWSKRWQAKLKKMSGDEEAALTKEEPYTEPLTVVMEKEGGGVPIQESYMEAVAVEELELVGQDSVPQELIEDGSVLYGGDAVGVSEVIVNPATGLADTNLVYHVQDGELTEATQAALLLLSLPPNHASGDT